MPKKILIIDDEDDIITFLETLFKKHGYETSIARNGVQAMKMVEGFVPDLITLDLQMPQNTGTDFYRNLRKDDKLKDIPIIVISGLPGRHLALPQPAAVFDKPIDPDKLLDAVEAAIQ